MNRIHIVGRKNHGKTTLVVELVEEFRRRGVSVGTIKHSAHVHELDIPGKDSFRHRQAGAVPAAIVTQDAVGVFLPRRELAEYERLAPLFDACEIVIVEGDIEASAKKVEVWRAVLGAPCLASLRADILAVVTDDRPDVRVPVWSRYDLAALADRLLVLARQDAATDLDANSTLRRRTGF